MSLKLYAHVGVLTYPKKKKKKKKKKKSIRRTKIEDIVITNADKGSAVVIVDVKDYITLKILKDK